MLPNINIFSGNNIANKIHSKTKKDNKTNQWVYNSNNNILNMRNIVNYIYQ